MSRIEVLGVGIDPIVADALVSQVAVLVEQAPQRSTVTYANVHVINVAQHDPQLRRFLAASQLCYCDGNGVRLGARVLGREQIPERMTGADWIWDLMAHAEGRWRIYWIGGAPGVTERAAAQVRARHPGLEIQTDHGFHEAQAQEDARCLERINRFAPQVVLVGMGTPIQERWVARMRSRIDAPVVWCLGATADFVAGEKTRVGPEWLVREHEWLSRLLSEPGRLWRRYLLGNSLFLARVARARLGGGPTRRP